MASQVPEGFRFTIEVAEDITIKNLPEFQGISIKAGNPENFQTPSYYH